jgi:hypothetical protein
MEEEMGEEMEEGTEQMEEQQEGTVLLQYEVLPHEALP